MFSRFSDRLPPNHMAGGKEKISLVVCVAMTNIMKKGRSMMSAIRPRTIYRDIFLPAGCTFAIIISTSATAIIRKSSIFISVSSFRLVCLLSVG